MNEENEATEQSPPEAKPLEPAEPVAQQVEAGAGPARITVKDFFKTELRAARVIEASEIEGADRLLKLRIDLGGEQRQLVAGIKSRYSPEELAGKTIIVVSNLEPARLRGVESQGMLLAASTDDGPVLATFDGDVAAGSVVK